MEFSVVFHLSINPVSYDSNNIADKKKNKIHKDYRGVKWMYIVEVK